MSGIGSGNDDYCSVSLQTDSETLWDFSYNEVNQNGIIPFSGSIQQTTSFAQFYLDCSGDYDVTFALDNVTFYTYGSTAGANPITPQPTQLLQNNGFSSGQSPWQFSQTTTRASFAVTNGQGVVTFGQVRILLRRGQDRIGTDKFCRSAINILRQRMLYRAYQQWNLVKRTL